MARILHRPSHQWSHENECDKCKSVTLYDHDDLDYDRFKISGYWFDDSAVCEDRYFLECPVCSHYAFIAPEDVPEVLKIYIGEKQKKSK